MNVPTLPNLITSVAASSIRHAIASAAMTQPPISSGASLADTRLPRLTLTVTARRVRGVPLSLKAGRYLLTVIGEPVSPTAPGGVMLLRPPVGMTVDEAMAEADRAGAAPPPFYFHAMMPGGVSIGDDGLSRSVIDLMPGEWIVAGYAMSTVPTTMTVTGALPSTLPTPPAGAVVTIDAHGLSLSGSLRSGRNIVRIDNESNTPRFVNIERVSRQIGHREVVVASVDQSAGTSMWMQVTLAAGTYVLRDGTSASTTDVIVAA